METSVLIAAGAFVVALIGLILNSRKDTRSDAASNAIIQTKLDSVINGVDQIRVEMLSMRESVTDHGERIAKMEARISTFEHRMDVIEGKTK